MHRTLWISRQLCEWIFLELRSQEFSSFLSLNGTKFIADSSLYAILAPGTGAIRAHAAASGKEGSP
jgi:hypothetical protein